MTVKLRMSSIPSGDRGVTGCLDQFDGIFAFSMLFSCRNSTYCMKVSMSVTVEASDQGKCFSSRMRYMEKAEITHSKMITCPDIEDYLAPYKQPQMNWYKVR